MSNSQMIWWLKPTSKATLEASVDIRSAARFRGISEGSVMTTSGPLCIHGRYLKS